MTNKMKKKEYKSYKKIGTGSGKTQKRSEYSTSATEMGAGSVAKCLPGKL